MGSPRLATAARASTAAAAVSTAATTATVALAAWHAKLREQHRSAGRLRSPHQGCLRRQRWYFGGLM